jgi:hypothetical protein
MGRRRLFDTDVSPEEAAGNIKQIVFEYEK